MALEGLTPVRARVCVHVCKHKKQEEARKRPVALFQWPELYFKKILKPESGAVPLNKGQGRRLCSGEERGKDRVWWWED